MANDLKTMLRREADSFMPVFDESLHNKTMSCVHQARRSALVKTPVASRSRAWKIRRLSAVLGALAVVAMVCFYASRPRLSSTSPVELNEALASLRSTGDPLMHHLRLPVDQANTQMNLFKDDAIAFGSFLIQRINVLPDQDRSL